MASLARDLFNHRYYRNADGGSKTTLDKLLSMEKKRCPSRIPYFFSASQEYPGRFLISYMPRTKSRHEFVSVTPDGYRFRGQVHMSVNTLIQWFKEHFRDPPPAVLAANRGATTGGNSSTLYSAGYQSTGQVSVLLMSTLCVCLCMCLSSCLHIGVSDRFLLQINLYSIPKVLWGYLFSSR